MNGKLGEWRSIKLRGANSKIIETPRMEKPLKKFSR